MQLLLLFCISAQCCNYSLPSNRKERMLCCYSIGNKEKIMQQLIIITDYTVQHYYECQLPKNYWHFSMVLTYSR